MSSPKKTFLLYLLVIGLGIFAIEAALELRHFYKGYNTLMFGTKPAEDATTKPINTNPTQQTQIYGPTEEFPFRSKILQPNRENSFTIWIASASHAEGGRVSAKNIFPNLICESLKIQEKCEVINGSKAGMTITENISQLEKYTPVYSPSLAILYQMSIVISSQERMLLTAKQGSTNSSNSIMDLLFDIKVLSKTLQRTALYIHLSDYIGGNIKLQGPLKNELPNELAVEFDEQIIEFITSTKTLGIKPVLTTFAASHNSENLHKMHFSLRTNFVKYNTYLSPKGWTNMVERYNERIRKLAQDYEVPLIDLDKELTGKYENFIDYVHFNEKGHARVAEIIGTNLNKLDLEGL